MREPGCPRKGHPTRPASDALSNFQLSKGKALVYKLSAARPYCVQVRAADLLCDTARLSSLSIAVLVCLSPFVPKKINNVLSLQKGACAGRSGIDARNLLRVIMRAC